MWESIKNYFKAFKILGECPREVWIMYGLTLFDSLAYFTLSFVLIKYLTDNFGFSDVAAGWVYGAWTMVISIVIFFVGAFTDSVGIKKALMVGLVLLVISRGMLAFVPALPDNQIEFKPDQLVHEWKVESYANKVPKGKTQPDPFGYSDETWRIEKQGDGLVAFDSKGERYAATPRTGHELACSDQTVYSEEEKAKKPAMLSQLRLTPESGEAGGTIAFSGVLRTVNGEKRSDWEKVQAAGAWDKGPQAGVAFDLTADGWVLEKTSEREAVEAHEQGYLESLASLGRAAADGRETIDLANLPLANLRLRAPDGARYKASLACAPDKMPEGALGKKLKMRGSNKEYAEVSLANADGTKKGLLSFLGILTDVHGHEVTMWKINSAILKWETHPELAGTYLPANLGESAKPLPKQFFWSKGNFWAMSALVVGLFILAFGTALMSPVILTAKKYYTNSRTRTTVFMGYYLVVNIAAMLAGPVVDMLRLPYGNQSIFIFGFFMVFLSYILVQFMLREGIDEEEKERVEKLREQQAKGETVDPKEFEDRRQKSAEHLSLWPVMKDTGLKLYTVAKESNFWRYILFLVIILGVRLVFTHWFMVMPKYYTRVLGEGIQIGTLNMINPFLISLGLIVAVPLIARTRIYPCFITGTLISAFSMVFLMIPGSSWGWLGLDTYQGYLLVIFLQIAVFSVGEVIWSPRTSEYAANIAPRGRVGTYMSLAALMLFVSKPLNGLLSGWLLEEYCPEGTYEQIYYEGGMSYWSGPEVMWVVYGLIAIASPIGLVLLRNVIQAKEAPAAKPAEKAEAKA
ncbi:MAG: MFS transporter [Myxococcales bacterium]|nr:MAG: MFS transporter [Myxococcales bacterium]